MTTYYHATIGTARIRAVEVAEVTRTGVLLPPYRVRRAFRTRTDCYLPTWQEAHDFLTGHATRRLEAARAELQRAQDHAGNVRGMTPP